MLVPDLPRWLIFSAISSFLCILGSCCVPLFSMMFRKRSQMNSRLLNYGLSLSAGSMLATSLYKMLPTMETKHKWKIFLGFVIGVTLSFILNFVVHAYTSESLIHCSHGSDEDESMHTHEGVGTDGQIGVEPNTQLELDPPETSDQGHAEHRGTNGHRDDSKILQRSLLSPANSTTLRQKRSLIDFLARKPSNAGNCYGSMYCDTDMKPSRSTDPGRTKVTCQKDVTKDALNCPENAIGYDLENLSVYRANYYLHRKSPNEDSHHRGSEDSSSSPENSVAGNDHDHHHHIATPFSKLLSIGIQTCLVISLHKFPEGFIVFFTNNNEDDSRSFGISIFLSLAIHNFTEGFAMTLPLYAAFRTKWHAILLTAILGGGSQPLGALMGYLIFKQTGSQEINIEFLLSVTSGFLFVIALQMFQTAIGFSDSHHHHEVNELDEEDQPHTLATVCLQWCCLGAFLVLATGLFT
ncbi:LADA_0E04258g1_1 [Lachancea dasiensis]|uniref:LADA_0E04258g1_1 n=1 Tax=Lachancea dasiensis TaxID=1072105 RepID=A0A1G4JC78_9SACH|nr:LADA_0E04258g1_1 [Lachancea dasiensis]